MRHVILFVFDCLVFVIGLVDDYWKLLLLGGWLCVVSVTLVWELLWKPISPMVHPTVSAMYYLGARK